MRAEKLVGRADQEVATQRLHIRRKMRRRLHRVNNVSTPASRALAHIEATSLIVPVRLLAPPTHSRRVLSVSKWSRSSRSCVGNNHVHVVELQKSRHAPQKARQNGSERKRQGNARRRLGLHHRLERRQGTRKERNAKDDRRLSNGGGVDARPDGGCHRDTEAEQRGHMLIDRCCGRGPSSSSLLLTGRLRATTLVYSAM